MIAALWLERWVSEQGVEVSAGDTSGHMTGRMSSRITVIDRVSGRRYWTVEQKLSMLRDAFGLGGGVRMAMDLHQVSSGQLYTWRRQAMSGELTGRSKVAPVLPVSVPAFAEVQIADAVTPVPALPARTSAGESATKIAIELPSGVRLTVDSGVDADALRVVLSVFAQ
jgi:transposase